MLLGGILVCESLVVGQPSSEPKKTRGTWSCVCVCFCTLPEHAARGELQPCQNTPRFPGSILGTALLPRDPPCLPLPGTSGQVPALPLRLGTACFQPWCHGRQSKQEQMCPWALLARVPAGAGLVPLSLCCCTPGRRGTLPCQTPELCTEGLGRKSCVKKSLKVVSKKFKSCVKKV